MIICGLVIDAASRRSMCFSEILITLTCALFNQKGHMINNYRVAFNSQWVFQ